MSRDPHSSSHSQPGYDEYHIEIGLDTERTYPLSIRSAGGALKTTFTLPFDEYTMVQGLQALLDAGSRSQQAKQSTRPIVREWGQALFTALFPAEARSLYDVSLRMATERGRYLQLRLNIQAPELAALPWEYLYDPRRQEPTVLARQTPIVRTLDIPQPIETLLVEHRLRILVMVAAPRDLPELEMTREQERIATAVAGLQQRGLVEVVWMTGQTWRDLLSALRNGPWHIFHFIGHGGFDTATEEGFLVLTDAQGNPTPLSATHLARLLADQRTLRLVLLNTCGGASGSSYSLFASTATTLVRRNIPAVLTMQSAISDHAAIELTQTFYEALADGFSITAATSEARIAMSLAVPNSIEWGTPVLYMRGPDSVLFAWPADTEVIGISTAEAKRLSVPALPLSFGTADTDSPLNIRKQNSIQRRRLDAAAPSTATLHRPIDLLVQVRFADSPLLGLDDWPVRTKPIQIEQVSELVQLTYPVDPQTGKLRPALLQIRVNTSDFIVQGREQQVIEVSPVEYSKRINFLLQPHKTGPLRVQIEAYNLSDVYLGSIPLEMEILADREIPLFAAPTVGNLSITVLVNSPVADSRSQPTVEKRLADRKAKESEPTDEVDSSETVETETTIDNRSGGVYFEGNQSVKIEGDVITGGTVNQATFHGPVSGPVHTGSGDIHMYPPQSSPAAPKLITNVWYLEKQYRFWQWRNPDVGTLELKSEQVYFRGRKHAVHMVKIQEVTHGHQPGDLNNNWVKVSYLDEKGVARLAFFADAKKLGIGNLIGGSDALFQALRAWQAATEEAR